VANGPRLYNARVLDAYLQLIRAKYPHVDIGEMLQGTGIEPYEVADHGSWFTQEEVNLFYQRAMEATGNENIAREAGAFSASPDVLGTVRQYALAMLGPVKAFRLLSKLTDTLTKSADYQTRIINERTVEVIARLRPGVTEEPFQCQSRIGCFEAIIAIFSCTSPRIDHEECLFTGGSECRYLIRWQGSFTNTIKRVRDIYAAAAILLNLILAGALPEALTAVLPASLMGLLALSWWLESSRRELAENTLEQLSDSSARLTEQININYRNTQLTREVGEMITSQTNIDDVIATVVKILDKTLDYDRGLVLLANKATQRLEIRGAFGYSDEHLDLLESTSFRLDNPTSQGPFVVSFRQKKPLLINDVKAISDRITPKSRQFIEALGTVSFLTVPILLENESIGALAIDNHQRKKPLVNSDVNLLMGIAPSIGVAFNNAALNEARENQFAATLKVLAHSIDARDFLTAGHSEKVAEYATGIAMELGNPYDYCQMIRIAALLHDYGKIGVPDTVLKKDGPLTEEERALIQTHAVKSRDILGQIPFEGINKEIPLIALHHHEKWDGTGYPDGLAGEEIPMGARIVAVADFFEAITSKRHYREPMPDEVALDLIRQESGIHFDPKIVHHFLRYLGRIKKQGDIGPDGIGCPLPQLREPRYPFQAKIRAEVAGQILEGVTVDLSGGGVFLQIDDERAAQLQRHEALQMEISFPNSRGIRVGGQVRWVNNGLSRRHPTGIGVAFTEMDQFATRLIKNTVHRLTRGTGSILYPQAPLAMQ
jgi:HD-GYP domain-containing protein (c-di-GMP phosphodiesterase class II)/Tfp pilus assembly protein PilZ